MNSLLLPDLFKRYVNGVITEDEKRILFRMIDDPQHEQQVKQLMDSFWKTVPEDSVSLIDTSGVFTKIMDRAVMPGAMAGKRKKSYWWVAASLAVLAVVGITAFFVASKQSPPFTPSTVSEKSETRSKFIKLPDGSRVILKDKSILRFPQKFGPIREVYLEGEGFFDIAHDPSKPFVVKTAEISTTVLGTAFSVKAFPKDSEVTVTVTRGKVQVSKGEKIFGVLKRDQQLIVEKINSSTITEIVDGKSEVSWIERDVVFDNVTMGEAVEELQERFDKRILLNRDQLRDCRFTASFTKGETLEQILHVICEFNHAKAIYDASRGEYDIDGAGCAVQPN